MLTRALPLLRVSVTALVAATFPLQAQAQFRDVLVLGAASLKNSLDQANGLFLFENGSGVTVSYGTSSALAKHIESGAPSDVFISDDPDWMNYVAERGFIRPETRADLLGNKIALIARADSNVALAIEKNFPLAQALGNGRLAMADPVSVAAGRYGKAALEMLGTWAAVVDKVAPAKDERAALLMVSRGEAPFGIVYRTDAAADKSVKIVATFPELIHLPIIYPIAILTSSTNVLASIYVQYLRSPKAASFFERQGFVVQ